MKNLKRSLATLVTGATIALGLTGCGRDEVRSTNPFYPTTSQSAPDLSNRVGYYEGSIPGYEEVLVTTYSHNLRPIRVMEFLGKDSSDKTVRFIFEDSNEDGKVDRIEKRFFKGQRNSEYYVKEGDVKLEGYKELQKEIWKQIISGSLKGIPEKLGYKTWLKYQDIK